MAVGALLAWPSLAQAQTIYVAGQGYGYNVYSNGHLEQYSAAGTQQTGSGDLYKTGLGSPEDITAYGGYLYVVNYADNNVGRYVISGTGSQDASFIGGFRRPSRIAATNGFLFVGDSDELNKYAISDGSLITEGFLPGGRSMAATGNYLYAAIYDGILGVDVIRKFDAITGIEASAAFSPISSAGYLFAMTVSGNSIYAYENQQDTIIKYDATTGLQDATFNVITGAQAENMSASGGYLFLTRADNKVEQYNALTGALVNGDLIAGLLEPTGIVALGFPTAAVPEPATMALLIGASALVFAFVTRRRDLGRRAA